MGELTVQDDIHIEIKKVRIQIEKCQTEKAQGLMVCRDTGGYKYLGILEAYDTKLEEMKGQIKEEYIRRVRNILKSKLNGGNIILAINSRAVSIVRYGAGIISWTKMELEELNLKTRKLMTMYGAQHPKADVDRLYLQRCEVREV